MGEVEAPEARINRTAARDVVGLEVVVFMEEFARVLMGQLQDVVRRQVVDFAAICGSHAVHWPRKIPRRYERRSSEPERLSGGIG